MAINFVRFYEIHISRLLCEGNLDAMKWIKQNYTKEEMQYYRNNENMNYTF